MKLTGPRILVLTKILPSSLTLVHFYHGSTNGRLYGRLCAPPASSPVPSHDESSCFHPRIHQSPISHPCRTCPWPFFTLSLQFTRKECCNKLGQPHDLVPLRRCYSWPCVEIPRLRCIQRMGFRGARTYTGTRRLTTGFTPRCPLPNTWKACDRVFKTSVWVSRGVPLAPCRHTMGGEECTAVSSQRFCFRAPKELVCYPSILPNATLCRRIGSCYICSTARPILGAIYTKPYPILGAFGRGRWC